jgi:hypothetical protein
VHILWRSKQHAVETLVQLLVLAAVAAAAWVAWWRRYTFMVQLQDGVPRVTQGRVTTAFLQELRLACDECGVTRGWVGGLRRGKRLDLVFSRSFPPYCQQRLRNLWTFVR